MRVMVFNAYYEPEIAASLYLSTNLYEDMADHGWNVDLFAPKPTRGVDNEIRNLYSKRKLETKCDGKLKIHRFSMIREKKNILLRASRYLIINIISIWKGLWTKADIIFVLSTPPTQGVMVAILKKIKKVPIVYSLQDIFPDSLVNTGLTQKGSFLWKIGRIIENYTYKNADKIIVISEDFKKNIMAKGVPEEKIEVVYNWVDENAVIAINREENILFDKYDLDRDKFYITYCGNIGFTQNMDMLLEVAKEVEEYKDIAFVLIGDGAYKTEVERLIINKEIKNVRLLPFQPYEYISHVFSLGDVGLIISKANIGQNSVPSKTWSIMSAERTVLASFDLDSELSEIINKSDCGVCVEAENIDVLQGAILSLYQDRTICETYGKNGRQYILENLTRSVGTDKIIKIIKKVVEL